MASRARRTKRRAVRAPLALPANELATAVQDPYRLRMAPAQKGAIRAVRRRGCCSCAPHRELPALLRRTGARRHEQDNPNWLLGLGERKRGIWEDPPAPLQALGVDPRDWTRSGQPVGLVNLGATCYMNVLLQCLFMNPAFREGVYRFAGDDASDSPALVGALQQLFGHLQLGSQRHFSPRGFAELLQLRAGEQQDVQEFNKLLLDCIEKLLEQSPDPCVRSLVNNLFRGRLCYVTVCQACQRRSERPEFFYELVRLADALLACAGCSRASVSHTARCTCACASNSISAAIAPWSSACCSSWPRRP